MTSLATFSMEMQEVLCAELFPRNPEIIHSGGDCKTSWKFHPDCNSDGNVRHNRHLRQSALITIGSSRLQHNRSPFGIEFSYRMRRQLKECNYQFPNNASCTYCATGQIVEWKSDDRNDKMFMALQFVQTTLHSTVFENVARGNWWVVKLIKTYKVLRVEFVQFLVESTTR